MPQNRYFLDKPLNNNTSVQLEGKEAIHLSSVMRKKENDLVELINGKGILARAKITKISSQKINLDIQSVFFEKEKQYKIVLLQPFIKLNRLELILEKCTELGCSSFYFFKATNSEKINFSKNKLERMQSILISSCKQCGRLYLPEIQIFKSLKDFKDLKGNIYLAHLDKKAQTLMLPKKDNAYLFVGPEKGFTKEEISYLKTLKAKNLKLNDNILRAETASITGIGIISYFLQF